MNYRNQILHVRPSITIVFPLVLERGNGSHLKNWYIEIRHAERQYRYTRLLPIPPRTSTLCGRGSSSLTEDDSS